MAAATGPGAETSPAFHPRAHRRIVAYVASCRGCPFQTRLPREAHSHSLSEGHMLAETRHYVLEPPE